MISKEAIKRGYNRGNYVVGAPTPVPYSVNLKWKPEEAGLEREPIEVPEEVIRKLRQIADDVLTSKQEVSDNTRDWWARTMIAETGGNPACPDGVVVRVSSVEQVQEVMKLAFDSRIPVTISAGRSNVTGSALPLRGGIILDICDLNKFIDFDEKSQIINVEAGVFGEVFEKEIQSKYKMTMGHWPSSFGISTIGGWVACRGAGQLSTRYGKIENMVYGMDVVLANGQLITLGGYGRAAIGPDLQQLFIGSEGTLGAIVRVRLKLQRLPDYAKAIAYGFNSFAEGLEACRQILQNGAKPAVLRLYDNLESGVQFGLPDTNVLLVADEGIKPIVDAMMSVSEDVCAETGKKLDEEEIFEKWLDTRYLTGKSAEGFQRSPGFVADTLEMIACWRDLPNIYNDIVAAINSVPGTLAGSAHQSHAYVDSACLYFSLRGNVDVDKRAEWYKTVWDAANAIILKYNATLSHHHGIGLLRAPYMRRSLKDAFSLLETVKKTFDPHNLLNPGKLGLTDEIRR